MQTFGIVQYVCYLHVPKVATYYETISYALSDFIRYVRCIVESI
jgi:hypothetical protein